MAHAKITKKPVGWERGKGCCSSPSSVIKQLYYKVIGISCQCSSVNEICSSLSCLFPRTLIRRRLVYFHTFSTRNFCFSTAETRLETKETSFLSLGRGEATQTSSSKSQRSCVFRFNILWALKVCKFFSFSFIIFSWEHGDPIWLEGNDVCTARSEQHRRENEFS